MKKKLTLKKERIKELSTPQMKNIAGGKTAKSSNNGFTCCWCLGGGEDNDIRTAVGYCYPEDMIKN